ncbi:hypothetical protein F2Q70_00044856 [Brassica cretica]|uniref:Uncharacterized protein n=1 Tax=Brassica cretica TaxID=69181 RepID=A0A8S9KFT1_BRACR|nr:hypothetical protein F2Q70_00044856 [Brassica cretica]
MQLLFLQFPKLVSGDVCSCGSYMVGLEMIMVMVLWLRMHVNLDIFPSSLSTNQTHRLPVRDPIFSDWMSFHYGPCLTFCLWASRLSRVFGTIQVERDISNSFVGFFIPTLCVAYLSNLTTLVRFVIFSGGYHERLVTFRWLLWKYRPLRKPPWSHYLKRKEEVLRHLAGVFGMDCDVTDGSDQMIFLEEKCIYSQRLKATKKILQDRERSGEKVANQPIIRMC